MRSGDVNYRLFGFIARLEQELRKKGWDQRELAKASDLSDADVRKTFQGTLRAHAVQHIAEALDLDYDFIFEKAILPEGEADKKNLKKALRKLNSLSLKNRNIGLEMLDKMLAAAE